VALIIVMGLLVFVPAGTIRYWQAWTYLAIYFASSMLTTVFLMKKDPALLERRMRGGPAAEKEKPQKIIMSIASAGYVALLVVPALDHRFAWSKVPDSVAVLGNVVTAIWFYIEFLVFRENSFSSATVELAEGQTVISTGPYSVVRHPMYAGALLLFISAPLALGSYWGLVAVVVILPVLIWRLVNEEELLARNLPGYAEYQLRVRYRLIPGIF
jgi:protein-S-isoprenylcysteine O-methyltransferase Ste14